jgi:hypothetical protein
MGAVFGACQAHTVRRVRLRPSESQTWSWRNLRSVTACPEMGPSSPVANFDQHRRAVREPRRLKAARVAAACIGRRIACIGRNHGDIVIWVGCSFTNAGGPTEEAVTVRTRASAQPVGAQWSWRAAFGVLIPFGWGRAISCLPEAWVRCRCGTRESQSWVGACRAVTFRVAMQPLAAGSRGVLLPRTRRARSARASCAVSHCRQVACAGCSHAALVVEPCCGNRADREQAQLASDTADGQGGKRR